MTAYSKPRRTNTRGRLLAATVLVLFLLTIDFMTGGNVRAQVRSGGTILFRVTNRAFGTIFESGVFVDRRSLAAQNVALSEQVALYQERAAGFDALKAENEQLRALAHLAERASGVTAPIISSVRASPYGTFVIGAGKGEGIERGALVETSGGFVVGRIADVGPHTSLVSEIFAPANSIEGIVIGSSLQLEGHGGGNARAQAPRGLALSIGEPVFAPTLGQHAIGIIGGVASSSSSAAQTVYIRLPVNLGALQYVYITH